jgi:hypothetical protein
MVQGERREGTKLGDAKGREPWLRRCRPGSTSSIPTFQLHMGEEGGDRRMALGCEIDVVLNLKNNSTSSPSRSVLFLSILSLSLSLSLSL